MSHGITEKLAIIERLRILQRSPFEMFANKALLHVQNGGSQAVGEEQIEIAVFTCHHLLVEHPPQFLFLVMSEVQFILLQSSAFSPSAADEGVCWHSNVFRFRFSSDTCHECTEVRITLERKDVVESIRRTLHTECGVAKNGVECMKRLCYHQACRHEVAAIG